MEGTPRMHKNHRRKFRYRAKHHGSAGWMKLDSLKLFRVAEARRRRAQERHLMSNDKFDMLSTKVRRDILWNYW